VKNGNVTGIDSLRVLRDNALAQKFHVMIVEMGNRFSAQNPDSSHGIMVGAMHYVAKAGAACGMSRDEFVRFAGQVFGDMSR
jgi:hypothetical protein